MQWSHVPIYLKVPGSIRLASGDLLILSTLYLQEYNIHWIQNNFWTPSNRKKTLSILHIYSSPVRVRVPIVKIYKVGKFLSCLWCTYYDSKSLIKGEKFYWMKALKSFSWQYTFCWCLILEIFRILYLFIFHLNLLWKPGQDSDNILFYRASLDQINILQH